MMGSCVGMKNRKSKKKKHLNGLNFRQDPPLTRTLVLTRCVGFIGHYPMWRSWDWDSRQQEVGPSTTQQLKPTLCPLPDQNRCLVAIPSGFNISTLEFGYLLSIHHSNHVQT